MHRPAHEHDNEKATRTLRRLCADLQHAPPQRHLSPRQIRLISLRPEAVCTEWVWKGGVVQSADTEVDASRM